MEGWEIWGGCIPDDVGEDGEVVVAVGVDWRLETIMPW